MRLLQSEVDVVPGRTPQKQPLPEGFVGPGTATLRIQNTTPRQNSYTVRIKCEEAYWQDSWFTLAALPPTGNPQDTPPTGKPDQPGPRNQSLTIFIKDGGTRDVLASFVVPEKSECRAGVYHAKIIVETRVVSDDPHAARKERITEIPITVIVRPFYEWKVSYTPEERRVGIFRRKSQFEVVVENHGNDWLYLDLKLPRPQNVLVETPVQAIAVPPPEPGTDSVRTIPINAVSRFKNIRGSRVPTPLPLQIQRIEAPTIPPLPEEAAFGPSSANTGAAVVANETNDVGVPEVPAKLVYSPPIPDTFSAFFEAIGRNARGLIFAVIGFIVAWQLAVFTYEIYFKNIMEIRASRSNVKIGEPFRIRGKNLIGSQILLFDPQTKAQIGEPIMPEHPKNPLEEYVTVTIKDKDLDGRKAVIGAQRLGRMTFLNRFLPITKDPTTIQIGKAPEKEKGAPFGGLPASVKSGGTLTIGGTNFGDQPGKLLINGQPVKTSKWSDVTIVAPVPNNLIPGSFLNVSGQTADGKKIDLNGQTVVEDIDISTSGLTAGTAGETGGETGGEFGLTGGTSGETSGSGGATGGGTGASTGTSAGTSGGGTSLPVGELPDTYSLLLTDERADYAKAATRGGRSVGALAVQAYALASLNRVDPAYEKIKEAEKLLKNRESGKDAALLMLAYAKATETKNPAEVHKAYAMLDEAVDSTAPGFVFKDIAIARFKIDQKANGEARAILRDALRKNPSAAEEAEIRRLMRKAGG